MQTVEKFRERLFTTVSGMLETCGEDYYTWAAENLESGGYSRPGSELRKRYEALQENCADGCDGQTHADHIADFTEFGRNQLGELLRDVERAEWDHEENTPEAIALQAFGKEVEAAQTAFEADCEKLYQWHKANGSLEETT